VLGASRLCSEQPAVQSHRKRLTKRETNNQSETVRTEKGRRTSLHTTLHSTPHTAHPSILRARAHTKLDFFLMWYCNVRGIYVVSRRATHATHHTMDVPTPQPPPHRNRPHIPQSVPPRNQPHPTTSPTPQVQAASPHNRPHTATGPTSCNRSHLATSPTPQAAPPRKCNRPHHPAPNPTPQSVWCCIVRPQPRSAICVVLYRAWCHEGRHTRRTTRKMPSPRNRPDHTTNSRRRGTVETRDTVETRGTVETRDTVETRAVREG
jgi:hypothetical protein